MFSPSVSIRLLHQSHPWTVAAIASARPKGKLDKPLQSGKDAETIRSSREAPGLMGMMESEAQHLYQYHYSRVSVKEHPKFEEG